MQVLAAHGHVEDQAAGEGSLLKAGSREERAEHTLLFISNTYLVSHYAGHKTHTVMSPELLAEGEALTRP